jgi:hypothetical protein
LLEGHAAQEIVDAEHRLGPQLTVMTSHGRRAVARMLRGRVKEAVLRCANTAVACASAGGTIATWPWALPDEWAAHRAANGPRTEVSVDGSSRTARALPKA